MSKPRTIHKALLPKDSIFPNSSSYAKKALATTTTVYVRDNLLNSTWAGVIRAQRGSYAAKSSELEMCPLDIIFNFLAFHHLQIMEFRKVNSAINMTLFGTFRKTLLKIPGGSNIQKFKWKTFALRLWLK
ncbi:unnamed protein product [Hymenolepis diminuta]|uniref:Uncharacterized protein n=1 Tax=Hymenolepis diminuta TaxID=6216 RepID=A0A564YDE6_HYMDI|nr:unnamed protein product [Hymenolepis diminuta]